MSMNLWHDVSKGSNIPHEINVIVEINKGSKNKYEIDKETGLIGLDRTLFTAQDYPFDYGFVPQSLWDDGDALDVVLLTTYPIAPGILVDARPVAIMGMNDSGEADDKIIAVPVGDPRWTEVHDLKDINKHTLKEIQHFFETYKQLQKKEVTVSGFKGADEAREAVMRSIKLYDEKYSK
mgnify:CR=1 FL=1